MKTHRNGAAIRPLTGRLLPGLLALCLALAPASLQAQIRPLHVIDNDRGGTVSKRVDQIRTFTAHGDRIEIRGTVCLSSCTMFLGAARVCIHPETRFGFHGPTNHGTPLTTRQFDYWSRVIAAHYPKSLARWYMAEARHLTRGYYYLTGAQLIQMGVARC